jgi:hypothetical protein
MWQARFGDKRPMTINGHRALFYFPTLWGIKKGDFA